MAIYPNSYHCKHIFSLQLNCSVRKNTCWPQDVVMHLERSHHAKIYRKFTSPYLLNLDLHICLPETPNWVQYSQAFPSLLDFRLDILIVPATALIGGACISRQPLCAHLFKGRELEWPWTFKARNTFPILRPYMKRRDRQTQGEHIVSQLGALEKQFIFSATESHFLSKMSRG